MATVTITASNVIPHATLATKDVVIAGESTAAGDVLYLKSDNKWWKAVNTSLEASGNGAGALNLRLALASCSANQSVSVAKPLSRVTVGSVLTEGRTYILSATAGRACNEADISSGQFCTRVGHAISATELFFDPYSTGIDA